MNEKPSEESIRHFIDSTWKDMHHSRIQNWTGITVVTIFHVGILKVMEYCIDNDVFRYAIIPIILLFFGMLFCLMGYMITIRHQKQLYRQLHWIEQAEIKLETDIFKDKTKSKEHLNEIETENSTSIDKDSKEKSNKWNRWNVGELMGNFYLLLLLLDFLGILGAFFLKNTIF